VKPLLLVLSVIRNAETRSVVTSILEEAGHRVVVASGCSQAHTLLSNGLCPDLVVVESWPAGLSDRSHRELLSSAPARSFCIISGIAEEALRAEAIELGIRNFLRKPVTRQDFERMIDNLNHPYEIETCGDPGDIGGEASGLEPSIPADGTWVPVIEELGENRFFLAGSAAMLKIYRQVQLLADVDAPVLILGESGTGKEVIAHLIHRHSRRSQHKFLNVNCAALPADLLESELFGYRQGAFTGAVKDKPGKFEQANGGTLLLDEIGEMTAQMQAKLLHVLQDGQFTRLGARESSRVDVRVLAATNVQIENALEEKTFREDLYYRLNVFTIKVPPLRERREEIPYLIEETIRRSPAEIKNGNEFRFSSRLMDAALLYDWRGNLRELRNFVTRTIIMRDLDGAVRELESKIASSVEEEQREDSVQVQTESSGMRSIIRTVKDRTEAHLIQNALDVSGWNRRHAAKYLNISYRGLLYKIQQYRLVPNPATIVKQDSRGRFPARGNASQLG
jgi:two-component system response regulator AtoC